MKLKYIIAYALLLMPCAAGAANIVASVNGAPITDMDITARTKLMALQGQTSTDNRRRALNNIIDDSVKLAYAANFKITPSDDDVKSDIVRVEKSMGKPAGFFKNNLDSTGQEMLKSAVRANMAWQVILAKTILPMVDVTDEDIANELSTLERERGLPFEMTFIRLTDIPSDVAAKLTAPKSCDAAEKMAENLGGSPHKITAKEYELSADIRTRLAGFGLLKWTPVVDNSVLLLCSKRKTSEYGKLDDMIRQNAVYKRAMFMGDQQLKQLRRKAVVIIYDDKYKDK